jgi:hypothetical protein
VRGVARLGPKDGPGFVNALADADEDLLVQLRALREIGALSEIVEMKDVGAALVA